MSGTTVHVTFHVPPVDDLPSRFSGRLQPGSSSNSGRPLSLTQARVVFRGCLFSNNAAHRWSAFKWREQAYPRNDDDGEQSFSFNKQKIKSSCVRCAGALMLELCNAHNLV